MRGHDEPGMRPVNAAPWWMVRLHECACLQCPVLLPPGRLLCSRHAARLGDDEPTPTAGVET